MKTYQVDVLVNRGDMKVRIFKTVFVKNEYEAKCAAKKYVNSLGYYGSHDYTFSEVYPFSNEYLIF